MEIPGILNMDCPPIVRQRIMAHFAGKGTASDKEASGKIPERISPDGGGAIEGL